jgi:membrane associated rhomboid family serine protease
MLMPFPPILFELPAMFFLVLWFAVQLLSGVGALAQVGRALSGGVAFWAHVVGFVAGLVLVLVMRRPERQTVDWWDTPTRRSYL